MVSNYKWMVGISSWYVEVTIKWTWTRIKNQRTSKTSRPKIGSVILNEFRINEFNNQKPIVTTR